MDGFSASVHVDASTEDVYDLVSDVTATPRWSPVCRAVEWTGGSSGPQVGATFRGRNRQGLVRWERECRVTEADPPNVFAFSTYYDGRESTRWRFTMEPDAGGTRLTQTYEPVYAPLYVRIPALVMGSKIQADARDNVRTSLDRIKAIAEGRDRR